MLLFHSLPKVQSFVAPREKQWRKREGERGGKGGGGEERREMQGGRDRVNEPADGEVAASRNAISA